jgi:hypothetical protein
MESKVPSEIFFSLLFFFFFFYFSMFHVKHFHAAGAEHKHNMSNNSPRTSQFRPAGRLCELRKTSEKKNMTRVAQSVAALLLTSIFFLPLFSTETHLFGLNTAHDRLGSIGKTL